MHAERATAWGTTARRSPLHADNTISLSRHARPPIRANCTPRLPGDPYLPPSPSHIYYWHRTTGQDCRGRAVGSSASGRIRQRTRKSPLGPRGDSGTRDKGAGLTLFRTKGLPRDVNTFRQIFLGWFIPGEGPKSRVARTCIYRRIWEKATRDHVLQTQSNWRSWYIFCKFLLSGFNIYLSFFLNSKYRRWRLCE